MSEQGQSSLLTSCTSCIISKLTVQTKLTTRAAKLDVDDALVFKARFVLKLSTDLSLATRLKSLWQTKRIKRHGLKWRPYSTKDFRR